MFGFGLRLGIKTWGGGLRHWGLRSKLGDPGFSTSLRAGLIEVVGLFFTLTYMTHSLNALKGDYIGDNTGKYFGGF